MHVSQLADKFVKDPHEVVKAGDVVQVRVVEVDAARKRIGLTMRKDSADARESARDRAAKPVVKTKSQPLQSAPHTSSGSAFADALRGKFGTKD